MTDGKVLIVGFGTLLDRGSLGNTIGAGSADEKVYIPVIVEGYRRLFNLKPDHYTPSHRIFEDDREMAAANVEPAEGHRFNGLAFEVDKSELGELDKRERYYRREAVTILDFQSGEAIGEGLTYISELDARWIVRDNDLLMPLWRDYVYARRGAYGISQAFGQMYDETTFLADGVTPLARFYADHLTDTLKPDA
ncbi:MAG: gamma-glutamylcyclotransferase family protein [Chloroflexota bacterium]